MIYHWNNEKNKQLKEQRNITFEEVAMHIEQGHLLTIIQHPSGVKYPNQKMLVVEIKNYVYLVPFIQKGDEMFLKTIIPNRKATKKYLKGAENEKTKT